VVFFSLWTLDFGLWTEIKMSRLTGRVKEGRKGLPLPASGDEKGAFDHFIATLMPTCKINHN